MGRDFFWGGGGGGNLSALFPSFYVSIVCFFSDYTFHFEIIIEPHVVVRNNKGLFYSLCSFP